jgi:hypothetical protein
MARVSARMLCTAMMLACALAKNVKEPEPEVEVPKVSGPLAALTFGNFIVELVGHYVYLVLKEAIAEHFYFRFIMGAKLDEDTTIFCLSVTCNIVYCVLVMIGFATLPREFMLKLGAITFVIGPALVLVLIAFSAVVFYCMAFYPLVIMLFCWITTLVKGPAFQAIGKRLGLDIDGDGQIDSLDVVKFFASTTVGRLMDGEVLHRSLAKRKQQPPPPPLPQGVLERTFDENGGAEDGHDNFTRKNL